MTKEKFRCTYVFYTGSVIPDGLVTPIKEEQCSNEAMHFYLNYFFYFARCEEHLIDLGVGSGSFLHEISREEYIVAKVIGS